MNRRIVVYTLFVYSIINYDSSIRFAILGLFFRFVSVSPLAGFSFLTLVSYASDLSSIDIIVSGSPYSSSCSMNSNSFLALLFFGTARLVVVVAALEAVVLDRFALVVVADAGCCCTVLAADERDAVAAALRRITLMKKGPFIAMTGCFFWLSFRMSCGFRC